MNEEKERINKIIYYLEKINLLKIIWIIFLIIRIILYNNKIINNPIMVNIHS